MNLSMSTLTRKAKITDAGPFSPAQPRVNLVPHSALERAADAKARTRAVIGWGTCVMLLGAFWGVGFMAAGEATNDLADANSTGEALAIELAMYAPVTTIAAQTRALNETVEAQTSTEVEHDQVIDRFLMAVGDTMDVESLGVTTDNSGSCVSTDPFQQVPLAGCVTFSGKSSGGGRSASQVISALTTDTWFVDPFIPTVGASSDEGVSMTGTVGLTMEAYAAPVEPLPDESSLPPAPETEG